MNNLFLDLVNISIIAGWLILAIILIRMIFKNIPKWALCILWGIVGLRLILPFSIESMFSLMPSTNTIDTTVYQSRPYIDSGITIVDNNVNDYLGSHYFEGVTVQANNFENLLSVLTIIWIIGTVGLFVYSIISYYKLNKRIEISVPYKDNIYISDEIDTPFIFGIYNPKIYVPSGMKEYQMDYVLKHEYAHLLRKDHIWKPLGFALLSIYWFNPLIWIAYNLFCKDIERACDEKVISQMNDNAKAEYSETLLLCSTNRKLILTCPLAFGEVGTKQRIKEVLNYKEPKLWIIVISLIACVVLALGFLTEPMNATKGIENFEVISGTYDLPIEVTDKQMNKIVKVLNSYSFEGKQKTNEEHLEEDCFEITYSKDGLLYKWGIRKTTTSLLVFKNRDLEYHYLTTDTQSLDEICEIVFNISFEEKELVDLLFTEYKYIAEDFVNENQEKYENHNLFGIYQDMLDYDFPFLHENDLPIKENNNGGAFKFFEGLFESTQETFFFQEK